jgi:glycosyltransferase involved in cell wall biosynthesis
MKIECSKPAVSIIIPVRNQLYYTKICLESIQRNTSSPYEVIVVDNGSANGTSDFLATAGVIVIQFSENRGVASAWNVGIKKASGEFLAFLNNDVIAGSLWLKICLRLLKILTFGVFTLGLLDLSYPRILRRELLSLLK